MSIEEDAATWTQLSSLSSLSSSRIAVPFVVPLAVVACSKSAAGASPFLDLCGLLGARPVTLLYKSSAGLSGKLLVAGIPPPFVIVVVVTTTPSLILATV